MAEYTPNEESGIECACCYRQTPFEKMAQCSDCHLVCIECFTNYTKTHTYGPQKLELQCMAGNCQASYTHSEMERCLSSKLFHQWEERVQEVNISMANLEVARCPSCNFAAIMSPKLRMFVCKRDECGKLSCRHCGVDWHDHYNKTCEEVRHTDKDEDLRKEYEERMTKSLVRTCPKCRTSFLKDEGCNRMKCPCGLTMCYLCRDENIKYDHFCQHAHSPGKGCRRCKKCLLWESSKKKDDEKLRTLKKEAERKRQDLGEFKLTGTHKQKEIGAPKIGVL